VTKANLFVLLQLALLLLIFLKCGLIIQNSWITLQLLAFAIGLWAIFQFDFKHLAISPTPKQNAKLVLSGPYKWVRNPMYLAVLLYCLPLVIEKQSIYAYFLYIGLLVVLHSKLHFEERLLKKHYPEYQDYCKRSKKLIPFIY
jgi:protein-S-isoprenylcysteine O-methyltransferase Ste14